MSEDRKADLTPASSPVGPAVHSITEKPAFAVNGWAVVLIWLVVVVAATWGFVSAMVSSAQSRTEPNALIIIGYAVLLLLTPVLPASPL